MFIAGPTNGTDKARTHRPFSPRGVCMTARKIKRFLQRLKDKEREIYVHLHIDSHIGTDWL